VYYKVANIQVTSLANLIQVQKDFNRPFKKQHVVFVEAFSILSAFKAGQSLFKSQPISTKKVLGGEVSAK
jgi:hypothetical protein